MAQRSSHTTHTSADMRAAVILSLVIAVAAEAPYHLPRPAAHAPAFNYPAPAPVPQPLQHHYHQGHSHSSGYHYPQPNIAPTFIQPAPQPQYLQPQQQYIQPQPQYIQPQPQYIQPQPQYIQPQPHYIQPQPQYIQPQPAPQLQNIQPQPLSIPSTSYGIPQFQPQSLPRLAPQPAPQPLPLRSIPQSQPQSSFIYNPTPYYQQQQLNSQQGYSYQQPQLRIAPQAQLPVQKQSQSLGSSALSSYQADTNLYSGAQGQTHREVLDSAVLDRVQNLIKENEHSTARNAGYLSLVSGVSLENAQPSIEISSFTQQSSLPVDSGSYDDLQSISVTAPASAGPSAPSQDYGLPTIIANSASSTSSTSSRQTTTNFLPQTQPSAAYGPPN